MIFDAIYRFYVLSGNQEIGGHKNRLKCLCEHFQVPYDNNQCNKFYELWNELFHEALRAGETPGLGPRYGNTSFTVKWLERLNSRLIVAISGYRNDDTRSGWWFCGWEPFGTSGSHQNTEDGSEEPRLRKTPRPLLIWSVGRQKRLE